MRRFQAVRAGIVLVCRATVVAFEIIFDRELPIRWHRKRRRMGDFQIVEAVGRSQRRHLGDRGFKGRGFGVGANEDQTLENTDAHREETITRRIKIRPHILSGAEFAGKLKRPGMIGADKNTGASGWFGADA